MKLITNLMRGSAMFVVINLMMNEKIFLEICMLMVKQFKKHGIDCEIIKNTRM